MPYITVANKVIAYYVANYITFDAKNIFKDVEVICMSKKKQTVSGRLLQLLSTVQLL